MTPLLVLGGSLLSWLGIGWLDSRLFPAPPCECAAFYGTETCPECGQEMYDGL
jgi:hypothetical protein